MNSHQRRAHQRRIARLASTPIEVKFWATKYRWVRPVEVGQSENALLVRLKHGGHYYNIAPRYAREVRA
jgi:hypothetical protein